MIELHSCSYFCERPDCIKTQRDEMRDNGTYEQGLEAAAKEADKFAADILGLPHEHTPVGVLVTMETGVSIATAIRALKGT